MTPTLHGAHGERSLPKAAFPDVFYGCRVIFFQGGVSKTEKAQQIMGFPTHDHGQQIRIFHGQPYIPRERIYF